MDYSTGTVRLRKLLGWSRTFYQLGWRDRIEILQIVRLAAVVEIFLRCLPLPRVARLLRVELDLTSPDRGRPMDTALPRWVVHRIYLTRTVLGHTRQTCLRNSLVLACRLRRLSPKVRIGVRKVEGRMAAHAWLEVNGQFYDAGAVNFAPVFAPASSREG